MLSSARHDLLATSLTGTQPHAPAWLVITLLIASALVFSWPAGAQELMAANDASSSTSGAVTYDAQRLTPGQICAAEPSHPYCQERQRTVTGRPAVMPFLYVSLGVLQGLDFYTTRSALRAGAVEANPLMGKLVGHTAATIAFKAASNIATVYFAEKLWRKNRMAAVGLLIAVNAVTAAVVAQNTRNAHLAAARFGR